MNYKTFKILRLTLFGLLICFIAMKTIADLAGIPLIKARLEIVGISRPITVTL